MYRILLREDLAPNIHRFKIDAPTIARKAEPGQFVIVRVDDKGERIPLTIADWDRDVGSITIVFNQVGKTTNKLAALKAGDSIENVAGPLGLPVAIENFGNVACVVGGYGAATILPIVRALKEAGNIVTSIIRAPSKETLFGEARLGTYSDKIMVVTGDTSNEYHGFVFEPLRELLKKEKFDLVITMAPTCVMRLVSLTTKPFKVKTIASLNPIMVDGTGMCGCCRVIIDGVTKFACVDGPVFDAQEVAWDMLMTRRCTYSGETSPELRYQCYKCAQW